MTGDTAVTAYDTVLTRIAERTGHSPKGPDGQREARCPAHDDRSPSLSIGRSPDGNVLLCCQAGCPLEEVLEALGLTAADLFEQPPEGRNGRSSIIATYDYVDELGTLLYQVVRLSPKGFRQRRPDGRGGWEWKLGNTRRVPYRLPQVLAAVKAGTTIYVVEGERDVHAVEHAGGVATCNPGGAGKWRAEYAEVLTDADVVIIPDLDKPGREHAHQVAASLSAAKSVQIVEPAAGKDAADHLAAGRTLDQLVPQQQREPTDDEVVTGRRSRLTWACDITIRPVVWAWKDEQGGRIPAGSLSVSAGREGTGKSTFGIWMAAQITRGLLPGNLLDQPRRVLYVALEDSWEHTLAPRLAAAGADLTMVARFDVVENHDDQVTMSLPHDNALLEQAIRKHNVGLVVLDPLMSLIAQGLDTNTSRSVRQVLDPLARLADRTGCLLLGIAHFNKGSSTDPSSLITGSGAFKDVPRSVLGFVRDGEDGTRVMTQTKNSLGTTDMSSLSYVIEDAVIDTPEGAAHVGRLVWKGKSDRTVQEILRDANASQEDIEERADGANWLRDYLLNNGGEVPANDIKKACQAAGFSFDALKRCKVKARVRSRKSGLDGPWVWAIDISEP